MKSDKPDYNHETAVLQLQRHLDANPKGASSAVALNRAGRRKSDAIARKQRHLFNQYKKHMAEEGYDATWDDFLKDMP